MGEAAEETQLISTYSHRGLGRGQDQLRQGRGPKPPLPPLVFLFRLRSGREPGVRGQGRVW